MLLYQSIVIMHPPIILNLSDSESEAHRMAGLKTGCCGRGKSR